MKRFYLPVIGLLLVLSLLLRFAPGHRPEPANLPAPAPPEQSGGVLLPALPEMVAGLPLVNFYSGEAAMREITRLHNSDFPLEEGLIGRYGDGTSEAVVWISVSANTAEADRLMELMVTKMPDSPVFREEETFEAAGRTVYYVTGMGMDHYYWQDGIYIYWLAVDPPAGRGVTEAFFTG
ncbi:MAG: hypothetical protein SCK29_09400 [Bacillota bacterium]|nr:hypothetical protein [Bacillota bacterium]